MKIIIPQPGRVRQVPSRFSWVDHRLIRDKRLTDCSADAWALYLFLVLVADRDGVSYYSLERIRKEMPLVSKPLSEALAQLQEARLVDYQKPFFQVLEVGNACSQVVRRES